MSHDDFKFEPIRGLPEQLPKGEHILWQGSPNSMRLARESMGLTWVASYFAVLAIWRVGVSSADVPLVQAVTHALPFIIIGILACLLILGIATVMARSTVYTLTNKRVAMRIGAAMTMTLNLPYTCIVNAGLVTRRDGSGTLALELEPDTRLSHFMTWPHVRPWHLAHTQPALRCIPNADCVAQIFADAAETRISEPVIERRDASQAIAAE